MNYTCDKCKADFDEDDIVWAIKKANYQKAATILLGVCLAYRRRKFSAVTISNLLESAGAWYERDYGRDYEERAGRDASHAYAC